MPGSYTQYQDMIGDVDTGFYAFHIGSEGAAKYQPASPEQSGMTVDRPAEDDASDICSMTWSEGLREIEEGFPEPNWASYEQEEQVVERHNRQEEMVGMPGNDENAVQCPITREYSTIPSEHALDITNLEALGINVHKIVSPDASDMRLADWA